MRLSHKELKTLSLILAHMEECVRDRIEGGIDLGERLVINAGVDTSMMTHGDLVAIVEVDLATGLGEMNIESRYNIPLQSFNDVRKESLSPGSLAHDLVYNGGNND